ncbi:MAG: hypothetical protein ACKVHQ_05980 [Gammaproteobacteria bacterium]|jgi:hypothetical protein
MQTPDNKNTGWADKPQIRQLIRNGLYVVCGLLVIADFIIHRHIYMPLEKIPAFYAIYGFIALVTVVLLAKILRKLVSRKEDYYEEGDKHD